MGGHEFLSRDEWVKVVKQKLGTNKFEVLTCKLKSLSEGCGFLGEHRLAEITVRQEDAEPVQRVLHFFIKGQPEALEEQKELVEQTGTFKKEVDALRTLFVELRSVLENGGEGMEWCCKCYYTRPDVIVLENLVSQGFTVVNSRIESRWGHCASVLKVLANLHSASLIFEEKQPKQPFRLDTEYEEMLREPFFISKPNHPGSEWMQAAIAVVEKLVEEIRGADVLRRMKPQIREAMMSLFDMVKTSEPLRNVVSHGDLWRNNMFFRHEEGEPVEARLVDYQIVRYTPPANDISCFLHLTTSRSFRAQYGSQLLAFYHDQLSQNLRRHDLDPDRVFPWEEFKESCKFYKNLGVVIACCYCPVTLIKEEDFKDVLKSSKEYERFVKLDRTPEVMHAFKTDSFYRDKISEVIEEFIEVCIEKK